jgi:preprotein translocase subunit SecG
MITAALALITAMIAGSLIIAILLEDDDEDTTD